MARKRHRDRFGSDFAHLAIPPPVALTPKGCKNLITKIRPGLDINVGIFAAPPNQVTPAMPVQLGIDLIIERAVWHEPARNRLELFDGNAYLCFIVTKPHVAHAVTFAITHQHAATEFRLTHGPGVPASATQGEGFLQEGFQVTGVNPGSHHVGIVLTPRAGSWWVMLTSTTKDFLWRFHWADVISLG